MHRRAALLFVAVAFVASRSEGAARAPESPSSGTAVVRGRVVAADTGKPLRRARVTIGRPGQDGPRNVVTDSDGRYEAKDLPAGQYVVTAARSGYLSLRYGQRRAFEPPRPLEVADARTIDHIDIALPRAGVIEGRVVDEIGDPIGGATVFAMRTAYFRGRRQLVPAGLPAATDDAGHYRVIGLSPGAYVLRANTRETWIVTRDGKKELMGFAPTYFPGTPDAARAQRVTIDTGEHAADTDFPLVPVRTVTVSGTAFNAHGEAAANVGLVEETSGPNGGMVRMAGTAVPAADGSFVIRDVIPGEFKLKAVGMNEVATLPVVVGNADVERLSLVTSPGWSASGTLTTENGTPPGIPRERVRITITPTSAVSGMRMQGEPNGRQVLNDDWTFSATAIVGPARFRAALPEGWAVKAVLHNGRDVTDTSIEGKSGEELTAIEIIVTDRVATVTAAIIDGNGATVNDGTVLLFASDSTKWSDGSRFVRAARPNQQGQVQVKGLPPGEYLAIALDYVPDGRWNDPEYLQSLRNAAKKVTLSEAASLALSLTLVP